MDNRVYLNELYNCYHELLKEKEQMYFKQHYLEDYSMKEISDFEGISRSRIGKVVKTAEIKLLDYEKRVNKNKLINSIHKLLEIEDLDTIKKEINNIIDNSTK